jgi:TolA-binding protein
MGTISILLVACAALCLGFGLGMFTAGQVAREPAAGGANSVQTMTITVQADTSQATAALAQLEQHAKSCAERMVELNRLAIHNQMGEVRACDLVTGGITVDTLDKITITAGSITAAHIKGAA